MTSTVCTVHLLIDFVITIKELQGVQDRIMFKTCRDRCSQCHKQPVYLVRNQRSPLSIRSEARGVRPEGDVKASRGGDIPGLLTLCIKPGHACTHTHSMGGNEGSDLLSNALPTRHNSSCYSVTLT